MIDHHHRFSQRHRGELHPCCHVTHGVDVGNVGLILVVHPYRALSTLGNSQAIQPQTVDVGGAPGGVKHGICHQSAAIFKLHMQSVRLPVDGQYASVQAQVHACLGHFSCQEVANLVVEAPQHLFAPVKLGDVCAQTVEYGCEFAGDVATTDHHQPLREVRQVKNFIGCDDVFTPHKMRHMRRATRGNQNVPGAECLVAGRAIGMQGGQTYLVFGLEVGKAVEYRHAGAAQQVAVHPVQAADFLGSVGFEGGPVQHGGRAFPAVAVGLLGGFGIVGGIAVQFFGNAAHVHTGAAQAIGTQCLCQGHPCAALGGHAGGTHAPAATADYKQVKVKRVHGGVRGV